MRQTQGNLVHIEENQQLPKSASAGRTLLQTMRNWHKMKPALFKKQLTTFRDVTTKKVPIMSAISGLTPIWPYAVVIPTYNRCDELHSSLQFFLEPALRELPVIVVDDGSTDATSELVTQLSAESLGAEVCLLLQDNQGPGAARNRGAQHVSADWIAFVDSDDIWFPWTPDLIRSVLKSESNIAMIFLTAVKFTRAVELEGIGGLPAEIIRYPSYGDFAARPEAPFHGASTLIINRKLFFESGGFSTEIRCSEDLDLFYRLNGCGQVLEVRRPFGLGYRIGNPDKLSADAKSISNGMVYLVKQYKNSRYGQPAPLNLEKALAMQLMMAVRVLFASGHARHAWTILIAGYSLIKPHYGGLTCLKTMLTPFLSLIRPTHYRFRWWFTA